MTEHPNNCDCDPCVYSEDVQEGMMRELIAKQVSEGYFDE